MTNRALAITIDRSSPMPLYAQLKQSIVGLIASESLPAGSRLPSEEELIAQTGLSRFTVRQALDELAKEGRVQRIHGKGTFVAAPRINLSVAYKQLSFSEDMAQKGYEVHTRILDLRLAPAPEGVAAALSIAPGTPTVFLQRLRIVNAQPFMIDTIYLRADRCPSFETVDLTDRSLFRELDARYGLRIVRARRTLSIVTLEPWAAGLLGVRKGTAAHLLTDLGYLQNGEAIEYAQSLVHGERSEFAFDLVRDWENGNQRPVSADSTNPSPRRTAP